MKSVTAHTATGLPYCAELQYIDWRANVGTVQNSNISTGEQMAKNRLLDKKRHCSLRCFGRLGGNEGAAKVRI
jgi:hypothetical protein